jgi:hypothetical protein
MSKKSFDISLASSDDRNKVQDAVREASGCLLRKEAENDLYKDIFDTLIDSVEMTRKEFNFLVKTYHLQNKDQVTAENEHKISLYETVFPDE